jgi:hypothetical protein
MGNTTTNNPNALLGLKKCTAGLSNIADSYWTWINPASARVRALALISELITYFKDFESFEINHFLMDLDAARSAVFNALIASGVTPEDQGHFMTLEIHSRLSGFQKSMKILNNIDYDNIPSYSQATAPQSASLTKKTSIWDSIWSAMKNFFAGFFDKSEKVDNMVPDQVVQKSLEFKRSVHDADHEKDRIEHERLKNAAEEAAKQSWMPGHHSGREKSSVAKRW